MNQTGYGVYHWCLQCKNKKNFCCSLPSKKVSFSYGNLLLIPNKFELVILKKGLFRRVKELSKVNQTGYGVYHGCPECKTNRNIAITCLGKKLAFHTEIWYYFKSVILKIGLFRRVKELSKVNQTGYGVYHWCLECKNKKNFCCSLPSKKVSFSYGNLLLIPNKFE